MIRRLTAVFVFIASALCICIKAQDALPANGLLSPEETLAYIKGLSERNFFEESVNQANEFSLRYPKHPFAESVDSYRIQGLYALQRYEDTAEAIQKFLNDYPKSEYADEFLWTEAESLFHVKKYTQALSAYEKILKKEKNSHREQARYRMAICLVELKRPEEAQEHLTELANRTPDEKHLPRIYARQYLAVMKQNEGDNVAALNMYQPLLKLTNIPGDLRKNLLLSAAYLAFMPPIQDYQQALELYGAVLAEFPEDKMTISLRKNLLTCHFALKNYREFIDLFEKYRKSAKAISDDLELNWLAAQSSVALEHYSDAIPRLKAIVDDGATPAVLRQKALQTEIIALDAIREDETLISVAKLYLEDYPAAMDAEDVLQRAANAEMRSGRIPEAIADFKELLPKLAGGNQVKYQTIGRALASLLNKAGDFEGSAQLFLTLAEQAPETSEEKDYLPRRELQKCALTPLFQLKTNPKGLELANALCDSETSPDALLELLKLKYQFAVNASKYDAALSAIGSILEKCTPAQQPDWLVLRARLNRNLKRYSQTADDYMKAVAHPDIRNALKNEILPDLVTLLYYTKRNQEAASFLEPLFTMNPPCVLSEALLYSIARERRLAEDFANVRKACERLLGADGLAPEKRDLYSFMLAEAEFQDGKIPRAKELLKAVEEDRTTRDLPQSGDCNALMAEIAIMENHPDAAIFYAKQALAGNDRVSTQDTLPRARWALAQAYFEAGNNTEAFKLASQGFILAKHPIYTPRCYQIAAQAKERLGDKKTAQELLKNLQEEYPDFQ